MDKFKIDVIIPIQDIDEYLEETLDSILNQRKVQCFVTVVDAGSKIPIKIPAKFKNNAFIQVFRSEIPLTAGEARNLGMQKTSRSFVSFLDADDTWPPERCAKLLKVLQDNEKKLALGLLQNFISDEDSKYLALPKSMQPAYLAGGIMFKRELWNAVGEFDSKLNPGEFLDWFNRFRMINMPFQIIDSISLNRRIHRKSTTANQIENRADYIKVVRTWMNQKN
jgi:glycosyltransferase involved in cell wall biosynthesis